MKTCLQCKETKKEEDFYETRKGLMKHCKECEKQRKKNFYIKHKQKIVSNVKQFYNTNKHEILRLRRVKNEINADQIRVKAKLKYNRNSEKVKETNRKYEESNPIKVGARYTVRQAIKNGLLVRPAHCSTCFSENKIDAHHCDYSKPLEVTWLCRKCHKRWHAEFGEGLNSK